jgi:hypothetical protein
MANNNKQRLNRKNRFGRLPISCARNIDAAEYKHVVLGLVFLKYISDAFEELYNKLKAGEGEYAGADPEDKGRIQSGKCILCASFSTLEVFTKPCKATDYRKNG